MEKEGFEYITLTRAFHADPHYVRKLIEARPQEILPCIGCNTCLERTVARVPNGCAANPQTTFETSRSIKTVSSPLRVLVVGGGIVGACGPHAEKDKVRMLRSTRLQRLSTVRSATAAGSSPTMAPSPTG